MARTMVVTYRGTEMVKFDQDYEGRYIAICLQHGPLDMRPRSLDDAANIGELHVDMQHADE